MKVRELGLAARDVLGLVADARPDRIDLVDGRLMTWSAAAPWIASPAFGPWF